MASGRLCGFQGCRNPVREGESTCWRHKAAVTSGGGKEQQLSEEVLEERRMIIERAQSDPEWRVAFNSIARGYLEADEAVASSWLSETPVKVDAVQPLLDQVEILQGTHGDLSVPYNATEGANDSLDQYVEDLKETLGKSRVERVDLIGLRRTTMDGSRDHFPEGMHTIVLIDSGTDDEVAVDPFVSMFAPVADRDQSVDDQLPSGETIFGDCPWVGDLQEYVNGSFMSWDQVESA